MFFSHWFSSLWCHFYNDVVLAKMLSDLPRVNDVQNVIQVHVLRTLDRIRPESLRVLKIQQENTQLTTWHELKAYKKRSSANRTRSYETPSASKVKKYTFVNCTQSSKIDLWNLHVTFEKCTSLLKVAHNFERCT